MNPNSYCEHGVAIGMGEQCASCDELFACTDCGEVGEGFHACPRSTEFVEEEGE